MLIVFRLDGIRMIALSQMYLSIVFSAIYSIIILLIESIVTLFFNNEILALLARAFVKD